MVLLFVWMIAWVVFYDITRILMPLVADRGPKSVRTSGFATAFFFVVLGVLIGVFGNPVLTSAFVLWLAFALLPLFRLIALWRRQQKISPHLVFVALLGCLLALNVGAVFQFMPVEVQ